MRCGEFLCWASEVSREEFVARRDSNMQDLEWLADASVRHQAVLSKLAGRGAVLPARFGLVFSNEKTILRHMASRRRELRAQFRKVEGADEWGIKVFRLNPGPQLINVAKSGSDYLKKKADAMHAELARSERGRALPDEINGFAAELKKVARDVAPGGSVSRGQPGLEWQVSILLPKEQRAKFNALVERSASAWAGAHRIEVTGPWPPYSFVKDKK